MAEEIMEMEQLDETQKYIDAINELKKNSISMSEYNKIRDENKKLLDTLVQGKTIESDSAESAKPDIKELRENLFKKDLSNLDYWKNVLELRTALIESGANDPFLPYGQKISPTGEDVQKANQVATVVQECIDYADGDSAIFTNELQRRTIDVMPTMRRK